MVQNIMFFHVKIVRPEFSCFSPSQCIKIDQHYHALSEVNDAKETHFDQIEFSYITSVIYRIH